MKHVRPFALVLLLFCSFACFSWGGKGHKIVAEIAKKSLDPSIIDSVNYFLDGMSWDDASVWMDEVRSDHSYDYMKPWHYVNVEKDKTYVESKDNVVSELNLVIEQLNLKGPRQKDKINTALKILFHLAGDLHQPLHAGYGEDKGGNTVDVDFMGKTTNLHRVWDSEIIDYKKISIGDCLKLSNSLLDAEKKSFLTTDVVAWMNESKALLPEVYDFKKGMIDEQYIDRNVPIIEKQLLKAGTRLAYILHNQFKKK
ncbi:MAG: S1/P1 nuclease [Bacteroidia bacterium]